MDYKKIASALLELVGGKSNIKSNATCMTRLRITVVDESKVNYAEIRKLEGVLGVVEGTTVQTIFGPGKVTKVGEEMAKLTGLQLGS
ncbi:MAG: PTS glucose/sucrose transporter subunit IIB, partial [Erysipelothrix sp.]|nr:PTS glucose/sucrose transporter subunit IIB [Erysipelothrix sp.]